VAGEAMISTRHGGSMYEKGVSKFKIEAELSRPGAPPPMSSD
jgi:hypothetical protein